VVCRTLAPSLAGVMLGHPALTRGPSPLGAVGSSKEPPAEGERAARHALGSVTESGRAGWPSVQEGRPTQFPSSLEWLYMSLAP